MCTYLQHQADASGVVDAYRALTEAEIEQPGYPRGVWAAAFELAATHFCTDLSFDPEGQG